MTLPRRILISALALAFLAIAEWSASPPSGAWAYAGVPGPDFQLFKGAPPANDFPMKSLDGHTFNLSNLKGKVVLLNFWRSNCPYCVMEKRYLKNMVKQMARPDLEVVSVNLWDKPSWIKSSVKSPADGLRIATRPDDRQWLIENKVGGRVIGYYVLNEGAGGNLRSAGLSEHLCDRQRGQGGRFASRDGQMDGPADPEVDRRPFG